MKKLTGQDLIDLGFKEGKEIGIALAIIESNFLDIKSKTLIVILKRILNKPINFMKDEIWNPLAQALLSQEKENNPNCIALNEISKSYPVYGANYIEDGALKQMDIAMRLPIAVGGALMPDAHQGYGLPIGGVLATRNAIIPYGVGVDIGCRMALSIYDISEGFFQSNLSQFKRELIANTQFGAGAGFVSKFRSEHKILDSKIFEELDFVKSLKDKAWSQLGSSGGGNHFVEFGIIEFEHDDLDIHKGKYLALLTHSGSRGTGAMIANHYTKLAREVCKLPDEAKHLAYFDLDSDLGKEYWLAMNFAGDYASACHEVIHEKIAKAIGANVLAMVENHHNFAWKEIWNSEKVIVHRKGATPAGKGTLGIIPGSMTAPGFLVRGKGETNSINSASHGAGRQMSRTKAKQAFTKKDMKQVLGKHDIILIGGGLDEAPMAYKDIFQVMKAQEELVDIVAKFTPKMVRMAEDGSRED
ncbi:MAG: RtcB family protein [Chitinophagales bacterium]|nr:RtcB family protein [Chitinophagales bacterium]